MKKTISTREFVAAPDWAEWATLQLDDGRYLTIPISPYKALTDSSYKIISVEFIG